MVDYLVDRLEVEAPRGVELTSTNSPCGLCLKKILPSLSINILTNFVDSHGGEGTPDPIPNSEVKLSIADDTA